MSTTQQQTLAFLLRKTVADAIKAEADGDRPEQFKALKALYEEHGVKSIIVKLPTGEKVATLTLAEPKPVETVDEDALLAWAREHHPEIIETVEHPAVAAWTEEVIPAAALKALKLQHADDGVVVTGDGEPVSGITHKTPPVKSFTVRYEGGTAGAARVIEAWRRGELAAVDPGETLPQIGELEAPAAEDDVIDAEVVEDEDPWASIPDDLAADVTTDQTR